MELKGDIRLAMARAAGLSGLLAWRERALAGTLTILTYHRVLPDEQWAASPLPHLVMPLSAFERQVAYLSVRFEVLTLSRAIMRLRSGAAAEGGSGGTTPRPMLAITFDDGYLDNYEVAAPVLDRAGVRGTFFLVSSFVGSENELWFDTVARWHAGASAVDVNAVMARCRVMGSMQTMEKPPLRRVLAALKAIDSRLLREVVASLKLSLSAPARRPLDMAMSYEHARLLAGRGHELGCHTSTHPVLTNSVEDELEREIINAKSDLERECGPMAGFCFPNGSYDERVLERARQAGYAYACTTMQGRATRESDPMLLPRININPEHVTHGGQHSDALLRSELAMLTKRG